MITFLLIILIIVVAGLCIEDYEQNKLITDLQMQMLTKKDNKKKLSERKKDELYQMLIDICMIACKNPFSTEWKRKWFEQLLDEVKRIERAERKK